MKYTDLLLQGYAIQSMQIKARVLRNLSLKIKGLRFFASNKYFFLIAGDFLTKNKTGEYLRYEYIGSKAGIFITLGKDLGSLTDFYFRSLEEKNIFLEAITVLNHFIGINEENLKVVKLIDKEVHKKEFDSFSNALKLVREEIYIETYDYNKFKK